MTLSRSIVFSCRRIRSSTLTSWLEGGRDSGERAFSTADHADIRGPGGDGISSPHDHHSSGGTSVYKRGLGSDPYRKPRLEDPPTDVRLSRCLCHPQRWPRIVFTTVSGSSSCARWWRFPRSGPPAHVPQRPPPPVWTCHETPGGRSGNAGVAVRSRRW